MGIKKMLVLAVVAVGVVSFLVSQSFAFTTACKWKDNKTGAFSMSFDDSYLTQAYYGIPEMAKRGLVGTFFCVLGGANYSAGIMVWESLCSRIGMDVEDHTLYHDNGGTDLTKFEFQIREASNIIYSIRPPGISKLSLFVQPGSGTWPSASEMDPILASYNALWSRGVGIVTLNGNGGLASAQSTVQSAISGGNWSHYYWHTLGPGSEDTSLWNDRGWNGEDFLIFLDYLVPYTNQVWVGTSMDITQYKAEYDVYATSTVEDTASIVRLNLTSGADPALYDYPLTLRTDISGGWPFAKISQNGKAITVKPVISGQVMYDVAPNRGEITLVSASAMDTTAPSAPAVRDGTGTDIDTTNQIDRISANWDECTDLESGISKYWIKAGISPGSSEFFDWIDNGTFTYVTTSRTYLRLSRGATYYVTVKAVDGCGNEATGTSDGQYVPLTSGYVKFSDDFETGATGNWDLPITASGNTIQVASEAKYSGNYGLKCHVQGTGDTYLHKNNISNVSGNFLRFNFKIMNLTIPPVLQDDPDAKYLAIAKMGDASDNLSALLMIANVADAVTKQQGFSMFVEFQDATDWQMMPGWINKYTNHYQISTGTWHTIDIHTETNPPASPKNVVQELWLDGVKLGAFLGDTTGRDARSLDLGAVAVKDGVSADIYYDNVAWSDCLFTLTGSLPALPADTTNPSDIAAVRDGTSAAADSDSTNSTTQLSANWEASTDTESGISKYWYAIGTTAGATNITGAWFDNGNVTSVTNTGLTLTNWQAYYFSVKAENGAGRQGNATNSDGQTVIMPSTGTVSPGIIAYPNPHSFAGNTPMKFTLRSNSGGEVKIFNMSGKPVREVRRESGVGDIEWDGTNDDGEKVARGIYFYKVTENNGDTVTGRIALK